MCRRYTCIRFLTSMKTTEIYLLVFILGCNGFVTLPGYGRNSEPSRKYAKNSENADHVDNGGRRFRSAIRAFLGHFKENVKT